MPRKLPIREFAANQFRVFSKAKSVPWALRVKCVMMAQIVETLPAEQTAEFFGRALGDEYTLPRIGGGKSPDPPAEQKKSDNDLKAEQLLKELNGGKSGN